MQPHQADYFGAYRTMKMMRDADGVLVVEFHSNGGRCTFSAQHHTEVVDAFHRIAQDRANKIVILTGAEGDFIIGVDWNSFGDVSDPGVWSQIHDEGTQVLENIANIRVPVIAAIEGRAHIHSDYALLANVIVAAEGATFQDVGHFAVGVVPGDGIFTTWSYRAGAGRAEMGSRGRSRAQRRGTQSGAGTGRAVLEGSGSDASLHAYPLHSTIKGAHCARSWIWAVARRSIVGCPNEIKGQK